MYLFIINPKSFPNTSAIDMMKKEISTCFDSPDDYHIHVSRYPRDAVGITRRYAARFHEGIRVYAIGGDGLLFDCLNGVIGFPNAELAAVPYGNTNDFARALGEGEYSVFKEIKPLLTAPSVLTDVIHCGSNYYLNFCSIGVESAAIIKWYQLKQRISFPRNKAFINALLTISGVLTIFKKDLVNQFYRVTIDGEKYDGHYAAINFSNGPLYGGDKSVAPEALFNDGLIDVLLVLSTSGFRLLSLMPGYLTGQYKKYPDNIKYLRAREISVNSDRPLFVNLDGERFVDTSLTLKILPSAVKMIAAGGSSYGEEGAGYAKLR